MKRTRKTPNYGALAIAVWMITFMVLCFLILHSINGLRTDQRRLSKDIDDQAKALLFLARQQSNKPIQKPILPDPRYALTDEEIIK